MIEPFNDDCFLHAEIARLIGKWDVEIAVETGTNQGYSAWALSLLCPKVYTIEINREFYESAAKFFGQAVVSGEIVSLWGSSPAVLQGIQAELTGKRVLFYLDAHWQEYWPLLDELKVISSLGVSDPIIVIHDFEVPGRPDMGYDSYGDAKLDWEYVARAVAEIFDEQPLVHYNEVAAGANRGCCFIEPRASR